MGVKQNKTMSTTHLSLLDALAAIKINLHAARQKKLLLAAAAEKKMLVQRMRELWAKKYVRVWQRAEEEVKKPSWATLLAEASRVELGGEV